ncbi:MAG: hypothetical protein NUW00_00575 [Candidatus Kaiserbacteria bacterium]|nr:hypothetical protein [Candidatus Kaiserbacteria bacterium]
MAERTENAMRNGATFGCLDGGGMVIDRDSGEYVPVDQVLHDPLHIDQLDILAQDHLGCLKLGHIDTSEFLDDDTAND